MFVGKVTCKGKLKKKAAKKPKVSITLRSRRLRSGRYTLRISIATVGLAARSPSATIKI